MGNWVHVDSINTDLPDTGPPCCMGSAVYGPGRCTCWEHVHDREQAKPRTKLVAKTRAKMCRDCAFRPDSPERSGDATHAHSEEGDLEALVASSDVFACHQGMRRRVALVHPRGHRVDLPPCSYDPPIVGGVGFKADGTPADHCAGLRAARKAQGR